MFTTSPLPTCTVAEPDLLGSSTLVAVTVNVPVADELKRATVPDGVRVGPGVVTDQVTSVPNVPSPKTVAVSCTAVFGSTEICDGATLTEVMVLGYGLPGEQSEPTSALSAVPYAIP